MVSMVDEQQTLKPAHECINCPVLTCRRQKQKQPPSVHLSSLPVLTLPESLTTLLHHLQTLHIQKNITVPSSSQCRFVRLVYVAAGTHIQQDVLEEV